MFYPYFTHSEPTRNMGIGKLGGAALACVVLGAVAETALAPRLLELLSR